MKLEDMAGQDEPHETETEVPSDHEHRVDPERLPDHPPIPATRVDSGQRNESVARTPSDSHPAFAEPLPGVDELVTVQTLEAVIQRQWVGPMADPGTLRDYDTVVPGAADRLLKVYESQTVQVADREDAIVRNRHDIDKGGQSWAGALSLICVLAAIPMLAFGNIAGGSIMLGMPVVILVASFLPTPFKQKPR